MSLQPKVYLTVFTSERSHCCSFFAFKNNIRPAEVGITALLLGMLLVSAAIEIGTSNIFQFPENQFALQVVDDSPKSDEGTPSASSAGSGEKESEEQETDGIRTPVPDLQAVAAVKKSLSEAYGIDFKAAVAEKGVERLKKLNLLSQEIVRLLEQEDDDPVRQYAIYEVSIDIAKQSCFAAEALQIVDDFEKTFEIDAVPIRLRVISSWLVELPKAIRDREARRSLLRDMAALTVPLASQHEEDRKWGNAVKFSELLRDLYVAAGERELANGMGKSVSALRSMLKADVATEKLIEELKANPKQPDKQLAVGCHFCFLNDDLERGLPYLKNSNNQQLAKCVEEDIKAIASLEAIGDLWWDLASDKSLRKYQAAIYDKAVANYWKAKVDADKITRVKLEKRIRKVHPLPKIHILEARFGWPNTKTKWVDVTKILREVLLRDPPILKNTSKGLGVEDPVPNRSKITRVIYTIDGERKKAALKGGKNNLREKLK